MTSFSGSNNRLEVAAGWGGRRDGQRVKGAAEGDAMRGDAMLAAAGVTKQSGTWKIKAEWRQHVNR